MGKKKFLKGIDNLIRNTSGPLEASEKAIKKRPVKKRAKKSPTIRKNAKTMVESDETLSQSQLQELKLENTLTIDKSHKIKELITDALKKANHIKLMAEECEAIDLSAIQLLVSLYKTAQKENKKISIDISISEEQENLLNNAGIYNGTFTGKGINKLQLSNIH